jgi:uncharacterized protein YecE (DUF72 family)
VQLQFQSLTGRVDLRIGTAGWSIPRASMGRFSDCGTHLERYARSLRCAEINSSFYRPHSVATYAKWRSSVLHGSPRIYWSWCMFDNTASGAAVENASELSEYLSADSTD